MNNLREITASLKRLQKRHPTDSITKIISNARKRKSYIRGDLTDLQLLQVLRNFETYQ